MTLAEIKAALTEKHQTFTAYLDSLNEQDFMYSLNGKWTAGQQLGHIYLSVKALNGGLKRPKLLLWYVFGRSNRPSKTYDGLVEKYLSRLQENATAPSPFVPDLVPFSGKAELIQKLETEVNAMCRYADKYSEAQLDKYLLPHPRLGKQTIREMLYFTIYHVEHHQHITVRNLSNK